MITRYRPLFLAALSPEEPPSQVWCMATIDRALYSTVEGSAENEQIKEALEQNAWNRSEVHLAGLGSLGKPLLEKILPFLLYGSQERPREVDISFEDIAL